MSTTTSKTPATTTTTKGNDMTFQLTATARKYKSANDLGLFEGSARYKIMKYVYANASKHPKGFTRDELTRVAGKEQVGQATRVLKAHGYLKQVA